MVYAAVTASPQRLFAFGQALAVDRVPFGWAEVKGVGRGKSLQQAAALWR
jgi:hypothetical protein